MKQKETISTIAAEVISWAFFPPIVGTVFLVFLVFWYSSDLTQGLKWLVTFSPFLLFIPLIFFAVMLKLGYITDLDITDRKERPIFLFIFIASLAVASIVALLLDVPLKFFVYIFSGLIMVLLASIITLYWKISFHTAVATSVVTAVIVLGGAKFIPLLLLILPIGWARVVLKKHTFWQVVGGFMVALVVTVTVFYLFGFKPAV